MDSGRFCISLKMRLMRITTKSILVAVVFGVIAYALIDGIRYQSGWGITMASCSLLALLASLRMQRKLVQLDHESGEEE